MLKWVLVLVFGVFTLNVNAQNLIWRKEFADKGKTILKREYQVRANKPQILEGEAITYFSTGSIKSKGSYLKNKPNGFWQFYYENGNLQFEVNYSDAVQNGLYKQYFQNGKLSRSGLYEAGKKTGKWTNFYESEQIQSEGTYIKGIRTGQWIGYYENGKKKYEHFYSNGKSWYIEFYEPCRSILTDLIDNLLAPKTRILTSIQKGSDDGNDIMRIVHDTNKGIATSYNSANIDYTFNYKVYYPIWSKQRDDVSSHSSTLDGRVIGVQITAQDKVYSLVKRMIDYVPF
jgi:hypothetical protein